MSKIDKAIAGKSVSLNKDELLLVAEKCMALSVSSKNKAEKEGYAANAAYYKKIASMLTDNGIFTQPGF